MPPSISSSEGPDVPSGGGGGDRGDTPPWWPLVDAFADLSTEMLAEHDEAALHTLICGRVTAVVPAVELASVTVRRRRGRLESVACTDPVAEKADLLQYELSEGPCMEAALQDGCYLSEDVASDPRWPSWAPRAAELGIRSLVCVRLPADTMAERHEALGALNLYAGRPGALGPEQLRVAQVYARHAGNALAAARQLGGLQHAVSARHLVGAAQGVLRQRYDLDLDTAFELLARLSSERNVKLRDLAAQVVAERGLPDGADLPADGPAVPAQGRAPSASPRHTDPPQPDPPRLRRV